MGKKIPFKKEQSYNIMGVYFIPRSFRGVSRIQDYKVIRNRNAYELTGVLLTVIIKGGNGEKRRGR